MTLIHLNVKILVPKMPDSETNCIGVDSDVIGLIVPALEFETGGGEEAKVNYGWTWLLSALFGLGGAWRGSENETPRGSQRSKEEEIGETRRRMRGW